MKPYNAYLKMKSEIDGIKTKFFDDFALQISKTKKRVIGHKGRMHAENCCAIHGCAYTNSPEQCPVELGLIIQLDWCDSCVSEYESK